MEIRVHGGSIVFLKSGLLKASVALTIWSCFFKLEQQSFLC